MSYDNRYESTPGPVLADELPEAEKVARAKGVQLALAASIKYPSDLARARSVWFNATASEAPSFLFGDHYLVPSFIQEMLSLRGVTSYDDVQKVVTPFLTEFSTHTDIADTPMEIDPTQAKRFLEAESFPQGGEQSEKRQRAEASGAPPSPRSYAWNERRDHEDPSSTIAVDVEEFLRNFEASISGPHGMLHPDAVGRGYLPKDALWSPVPSDETWSIHQCRKFVKMLIPRIPLCEPSRPDLLLYLLGELEKIDPGATARVDVLSEASKECIVNNTSGSGKTRLLLELSCTQWTFYFTLSWDPSTNPYGSRDCFDAIQMLADVHRFRKTGDNFQPEIPASDDAEPSLQANINRWFRHWKTNAEIADQVYSLVLLSRLLIYQRFRRLVANHPEAKAMRAWCLLQVCPSYSGISDVFSGLLGRLAHLSTASADTEIARLLVEIRTDDQLPFAVIFDEAQNAAQQCTTLFGRSLSEPERLVLGRTEPPPSGGLSTPRTVRLEDYSRPLLKPIVNAFRRWLGEYPCRTLIAGTKLHRGLITEALASSIGKAPVIDDFVDFGVQDTPDKIKGVLEHFLGKRVVSKISPAMLDEMNFWLQGWHRFVSIFLFGVLVTGGHPGGMMNVLSNMLKKLTGRALIGSDHKDLPFLKMDLIIPSVIRNPSSVDDGLRTFLRDAVLQFLVKGKLPCYSQDDLDLVSLGLARFTGAAVDNSSERSIVINEHLVLVTLFHWLRGNAQYSPLRNYLDESMADPQRSSAGFAFEDVMGFLFWDWFGDGGRPLNEIFTFESPEPKWASQNARLISVFRDNTPDSVTRLVDQLHTTELAYCASSAHETLDWFSGYYGLDRGSTAQCRCPMLKPDTDYGGDVVFGLLLEDGTELKVNAQCKLWGTVHYKKDVEYELWKLSLEGVYKGEMTPEIQTKFNAVMERFKAPRGFVPEPSNGKPSYPDQVKYRPYPPKYRVLRVLAAFEKTYSVPDGIFGTKAIGSYPFAILSRKAVHIGSSHFSSFKYAAERAVTSEKAEEKRKAKEEKDERVRVAAKLKEDAESKLRRSVRNRNSGNNS